MINPAGSKPARREDVIPQVSTSTASSGSSSSLSATTIDPKQQVVKMTRISKANRANVNLPGDVGAKLFRLEQRIAGLIPTFRHYRAISIEQEIKEEEYDNSSDFNIQEIKEEECDNSSDSNTEADYPKFHARHIKTIEVELKMDIQELCEEFEIFDIDSEAFSGLWKLDRVSDSELNMHISFIVEQIINNSIDKIIFLHHVKSYVRSNIVKISEELEWGGSKDFSDCEIQLRQVESETHNRGQSATKVTVTMGDGTTHRLFFKPRSAEIDKSVVELFGHINQLEGNEKSSNVELPTYRIMTDTMNEQDVSIWEFVEGHHEVGYGVNQIIEGLPSQRTIDGEKEKLSAQVARLDSILCKLDVSDLHPKNVLFRGLGSTQSEIVPIDLESIQVGAETGLYMREVEHKPLSQQEQGLVRMFKKKLSGLPYRLVPIPTSHFLGALNNCLSFTKIAANVSASLINKGYGLLVDDAKLQELVLEDMIHDDVPYLLEKEGAVYYGGQKVVIAERKEP